MTRRRTSPRVLVVSSDRATRESNRADSRPERATLSRRLAGRPANSPDYHALTEGRLRCRMPASAGNTSVRQTPTNNPKISISSNQIGLLGHKLRLRRGPIAHNATSQMSVSLPGYG
jgi:hypothetical protein